MAKHHITAPAVGGAGGVAVRRSHNHIGQAVAVDDASRTHCVTTAVATRFAVDDKATRAARHGAQVDGGARSLAKHHITAPAVGGTSGVAVVGTHDHVGQAVAVDVACAADRDATAVARRLAVDDKATRAARHGAEVDGGARSLTKHHITAPAVGGTSGVAAVGTDDQVVQTIAVDVASRTHRDATVVGCCLAIDDKAAATPCNVGQVDRRGGEGEGIGGAGGCRQVACGIGGVQPVSARGQTRQGQAGVCARLGDADLVPEHAGRGGDLRHAGGREAVVHKVRGAQLAALHLLHLCGDWAAVLRRGRGRRGVDQKAGVVGHSGVGQPGAAAPRVNKGAAVQAQAVGVYGDAIGIGLAGQHGVGEVQRRAAAAARVTGLHSGAVDVQPQLGRASDRDRFAEGDGGHQHITGAQGVVLHPRGAGDGHAADDGIRYIHRYAVLDQHLGKSAAVVHGVGGATVGHRAFTGEPVQAQGVVAAAFDHHLVALLRAHATGPTGGQVVGAVDPAGGVVEVVHARHVDHIGGVQTQGVGRRV